MPGTCLLFCSCEHSALLAHGHSHIDTSLNIWLVVLTDGECNALEKHEDVLLPHQGLHTASRFALDLL